VDGSPPDLKEGFMEHEIKLTPVKYNVELLAEVDDGCKELEVGYVLGEGRGAVTLTRKEVLVIVDWFKGISEKMSDE
jgi:hypothetical protein